MNRLQAIHENAEKVAHEKKTGSFCLHFVREKIRYGEELSFKVATDSMLPFISPRDRIAVTTCTPSEVKPGDIVLFERGSSLIVHRLLRTKTNYNELVLVPKADRAYREEDPFTAEQLLGKVVRIHKKSLTYHLDRWHGKAVNKIYYTYSLLKMRAYAVMTWINQRRPKNEDYLIRLCSVKSVDEKTEAAISTVINQHIDWEYFLKRVQGEDTASLIYKVLLQTSRPEAVVPRHVMNYLKDFYYAVLAQNISLSQSVEHIVTSLQKENIEPLVFKGLMLAGSIYKDIGLRPMGDADILLRKEDLAKADRILRLNGFHPEFELNDFENLSPGQYRNSLVYRSTESGHVAVHVHWHIVNFTPFHEKVLQNIDMDKVWNESVPLHAGQMKMKTFSLHHQIIYLSMHALNHSFHPLIRLCDIHELLQSEKDTINWDRLINEAHAFQLSKSVYYVFHLLTRMFCTDIPAFVLYRLRPRRIGIIERTFLSSVLAGDPILTGEWLICFGMNDTLKDKFLFLRKLLFPPQQELAIIRKRDDGRAGMSDYLKRLTAGLGCALKVMLNFTMQASFKL
jgi:hypothetical protein